MATIELGDYAANDIKNVSMNGASMIVGSCTDGDVVKHPFRVVLAVVVGISSAVAAGQRLHCDRSTAGQITFADAANTGDIIDFAIIGY